MMMMMMVSLYYLLGNNYFLVKSYWAVTVVGSKARFPLPELTARVNGPSSGVTGFHYQSTRAVLTGARFH